MAIDTLKKKEGKKLERFLTFFKKHKRILIVVIVVIILFVYSLFNIYKTDKTDILQSDVVTDLDTDSTDNSNTDNTDDSNVNSFVDSSLPSDSIESQNSNSSVSDSKFDTGFVHKYLGQNVTIKPLSDFSDNFPYFDLKTGFINFDEKTFESNVKRDGYYYIHTDIDTESDLSSNLSSSIIDVLDKKLVFSFNNIRCVDNIYIADVNVNGYNCQAILGDETTGFTLDQIKSFVSNIGINSDCYFFVYKKNYASGADVATRNSYDDIKLVPIVINISGKGLYVPKSVLAMYGYDVSGMSGDLYK